MEIKFGPAGNSDSFYADGFKASEDMPKWLKSKGLDAYEYQCGNGVRCGDKTAEKIRQNAKESGITLSVHSPYYINLATAEPEKRKGSIGYIMQTLELAKKLDADRIVVHSGAICKLTREQALENAKLTLTEVVSEMKNAGLYDIHLCIETMGKINQLGDLNEVMELCRVDESFLPCIDFGHLNARTLGGIKTKADYAHILDTMENKLGLARAKAFHSHFSKIEYTVKGGEKKHLTFEDTEYGPFFEPLGELLYERSWTPTIICESAGTQAEDAIYMKQAYLANAE
ncbi:MAG: TIM barrel protein [Clostridia bacterium]|nr:TIM barrel protein [Clostridia bacterium]